MTGGFRQNVVPPEAECMILGLFDRDVQSACDEVARTTARPSW